MSADAEKQANGCTHPEVKGAVHALLKAIASHIVEGQTTTSPLTVDDLAVTARIAERTAQRCLRVLERIGLIQVHGGGRGKVARYEMLQLTAGARPITDAPLPLVGAAKPPRTKEQRSGSDLLSVLDHPASEETAIKVGHFVRSSRSVLAKVGHCVRSCWRAYDQTAIRVGHFVRSYWARTIKQRSGSDPAIDAHQLDRARDVRTTTTTRTTTARARETTNAAPLESRPPPSTPIHPWHAWCGRVCVPKGQHAEFLQLLGRRPGETAAALDARAFACYATELATIPADQPIAITTEFKFWRPRFKAMLAAAAPARAPTPPIDPAAGDDVWAAILDMIGGSADIDRRTFMTWFLPTALVEDRGAVIVVVAPSDLFVDWIEKHYADVVHQAVEIVRPGARIEFRRQQRKSG